MGPRWPKEMQMDSIALSTRSFVGAWALGLTVALAACGGDNGTDDDVPGGNSSPGGNNPSTYTVGGTVSGLQGSGLVLQSTGGDDLPISADGAFVFATRVADGSAYAVTVKSPS